MRFLFVALCALWLTACASTPQPAPKTPEPIVVQPTPDPDPPLVDEDEDPVPLPPIIIRRPDPKPVMPPSDKPQPLESVFDALPFWYDTDMRPALAAFKRSCALWKKRDTDKVLHKSHPQYGRVADWLPACSGADTTANNKNDAREFFEREFLPVYFESEQSGLLTAYYQPEVSVSKTPTKEFREPILAVPTNKALKNKPRKDISAASARVIAFGRPIDVFFMQIQGSGILVFPDGSRMRASYADNNGYTYKSIGGVLIRRGELTKDQASKQSIETWMEQAGRKKARALMNENPRYIFFKDEPIVAGEGPKGAQLVPLTAMGSLAVDPKYYPYGLPVWIEAPIPQEGGDYKGTPQGLLLIAQDTGNAIKGASRGDIYFGSGNAAGAKAGVMKHEGRWTLLLPTILALMASPVS